MIDVDSADLQSPQRLKNPLPVRAIAAVLAVIILTATAWILWFFLSPSRTVQISEGASYDYANYSVKVEKLTDRYCPGASDVDCTNWLNEDGVQLSYTSPGKAGVSFYYLGLDSKNTLELPGLKIELKSLNFEKRAAELRLSKQ